VLMECKICGKPADEVLTLAYYHQCEHKWRSQDVCQPCFAKRTVNRPQEGRVMQAGLNGRD